MNKVIIRVEPFDSDRMGCAEVVLIVNDNEIMRGIIGGEPEDNRYYRDYKWIAPMLKRLAEHLGANAEVIITSE